MSGAYATYGEMRELGQQWFACVPAHWRVRRLKTLFKIRKEIAGRLGFDVLSVTQRGIKKKDLESGEGQLSMDYSKYQLVRPNDFVMNHMDLLTGFIDISQQKGVTSPDYRVFTSRPEVFIAPRYYLYIFQMCYAERVFFPLGQGSAHLGRWRLPRDAFEGFLLPLPPRDEQTQIAKFLDYETARIDALIEKQQQLIALLKEKRQAVISHAVTKGLNPDAPLRDSGVEWLGEVPAHWTVTPLKHHVLSLEQGWSPQCDAVPADDDHWGVLKVGCVNGGVFNRTENKQLPEDLRPIAEYALRRGDLLVSRANTRELVGSAAVVLQDEPRLMLCDKLYRLRLGKRVAPEFVSLFLGISLVRQQVELEATGASHSMQNIGQGTIQNLPTLVPPYEEAEEIVKEVGVRLKGMDSIVEKATLQMDLLQERRTALISAAVTGKIDVRGWTPPAKAQSA